MKCREGLLWRIIELALRRLECPTSLVRFDYAIGPVTNKPKIQPGNIPMKITITNEQKIKVTLTPVTGGGHPAPLDGVPTWEVIDGDSTVEVASDGLSAELVSADDPGTTNVLVKADADLGEGVVPISDVIQLTVLGAQATNLGLTAGDPENK